MKTNSDCVFCKIINNEIPANKIYEDDNFLAFLDIKPNNLGHTLLIPKDHHKNIFDLPDEILSKLGKSIQTIATGVLKGTEASGINIAMNNGETAGQIVWHTHIHIIPRFANDKLNNPKPKEDFTAKDFSQMAEKIKTVL